MIALFQFGMRIFEIVSTVVEWWVCEEGDFYRRWVS